MMRKSLSLVLAISTALVLANPPGADASFPGDDGLILFSDGDLWVVRPDGSGLRPITSDRPTTGWPPGRPTAR